MKSAYPNYNNTTFQKVKKGFSDKNQKIIDNFLKYCGITACESSLKKIHSKIIQIADVLDKSLFEINLTDIREFLRLLNLSGRAIETQNDLKKTLKRFLRWQYKDWSERFDDFKDVKTKNGENHKKINSSTLLTDDEIKKLIRAADSLRYKALIVLTAESAGRPEEIRNLTWENVLFKKNSVEVNLFSSKTKRSRVLPLKESLVHLKRWKNEFPYENIKGTDFVFPSPKNRNKPLSGQAFSTFIRQLGIRIIGRPVFPCLAEF